MGNKTKHLRSLRHDKAEHPEKYVIDDDKKARQTHEPECKVSKTLVNDSCQRQESATPVNDLGQLLSSLILINDCYQQDMTRHDTT